jgi:hypothetical protein
MLQYPQQPRCRSSLPRVFFPTTGVSSPGPPSLPRPSSPPPRSSGSPSTLRARQGRCLGPREGATAPSRWRGTRGGRRWVAATSGLRWRPPCSRSRASRDQQIGDELRSIDAFFPFTSLSFPCPKLKSVAPYPHLTPSSAPLFCRSDEDLLCSASSGGLHYSAGDGSLDPPAHGVLDGAACKLGLKQRPGPPGSEGLSAFLSLPSSCWRSCSLRHGWHGRWLTRGKAQCKGSFHSGCTSGMVFPVQFSFFSMASCCC